MAQSQLPIRDWMTGDRVRRLLEALTRDGAEARFVGGCVRDGLINRPVSDIDVATTALPEVVTELVVAAGLRAIPTGIDHGTVTVVVDGRGFEVTTLRQDVETDGRRAVVAFTEDWQVDAARRDFTMNAMSARPDGALFDYFGGAEDLAAGRVRFVGDPAARIAEDVLRLLRFYRFHAWYGTGAPDAAARAACRAQTEKLPGLSAERVREELIKTLRAPDPASVFRLMMEDGVLAHCLPEARNVDRLDALVRLDGTADAIRRLGAVLADDADPVGLADALRLSRRDARRLANLLSASRAIDLDAGPRDWRRWLHERGAAAVEDGALIAAAGAGAGEAALAAMREALGSWTPKTMPIAGADLVAAGVPEGPRVGDIMRALEAWWVGEDFQPEHDALLEKARALVASENGGDKGGDT